MTQPRMVTAHKNVAVVYKIARFVPTQRDAYIMIFGGPIKDSEARLGDPEPLFCILLFALKFSCLSLLHRHNTYLYNSPEVKI